MKKTMKPTKAFTTKLSLCCGQDTLRPALSRIHFHEDNAVCTDAHLIIKMPLSFYGFTKEDKALLNGYTMSQYQLSLILKKEVLVMDGSIDVVGKGLSVLLQKATPEDLKLMDMIKKVVDEAQSNPIDEIGLNPRLLNNIFKAMGWSYNCVLRFNHANKAIMVRPNQHGEEGTAILMPTMIFSSHES